MTARIAVALLASALTLVLSGCGSATASTGVSIILTAFGDKNATFGETQPFLLALQGRVDRTGESAFCQGVYEGRLSGQPVVVVTAGTGTDNAGPCMQELLQLYGVRVKEVIWSGIGGATPAVGGLLDAAGKLRNPAVPVMIGDVCISALAWNYDLQISSVASWAAASRTSGRADDPAGGWNAMKDAHGKTLVSGFETVQLFTVADRTLADELTAAGRTVQWPAPASDVPAKELRYFDASALRPVRLFDSSQCGEITGNGFWHGVVEDRLARQQLASLIAASGYGPGSTSEGDVVVFSGMESATWMSVLQRWGAHRGAKVPMAVVRAASNYVHPALDAAGQAKPGPNGQPLSTLQDILLSFEGTASPYAWNNAALPVLKLFELRNQRQLGQTRYTRAPFRHAAWRYPEHTR